MTQTALILGARGRFGRAMAQSLKADGWDIRPFDRDRDDLDKVAAGVDVIVNGWNPPYHHWAAQVPALHARVRQAALRADATVLLPGNVYVFGPGSGPIWSEQTPHRAENPLGLIRRRMEQDYRADGVRTVVLRAGDFIDTAPSGNWFDRVMTPALPRGVLRYPGPADVLHAWAFLPDMARAAAGLLVLRHQLPRYADIPFPGYTLTGLELAAGLAEAMGRPVRVRPFGWWQLHLARPFMPVVGGMIEMRYLWSLAHRLDAQRLTEHLPEFTATPLPQALARALAHLRPAA